MTNEERLAALEIAREYERDWRLEMIARLNRVENNQRWMSGLLALILVAVLGSNLLG